MNKLKYILGAMAVLAAAIPLQARQTDADSLRTNTWSVYLHGGVGGHHGVRSQLYDNAASDVAPQLDLGVKYNYRPWVRFGVNVGYTLMNAADKSVLSVTAVDENFMIDDRPATLTTRADRLQNRNDAHLLGFDLNADFNLANAFKKNRKSHWLNVYAGLGVGYMHGWNRNTQSWSFKETAVAEGASYAHKYSHSYLRSEGRRKGFNALYIPFTASVEFDVLRELTLGVQAQYKYLPTTREFTPKGIYNIGFVVRYNFVKGSVRLYRERAELSQQALAYQKQRCAGEQARLNEALAAAEQEQAAARNEIARLKDELAAEKERAAKAKSDLVEWMSSDSNVFFAHDSDELDGSVTGYLDTLVAKLTADPAKKVVLVGSATAVGDPAYNKMLSDRRIAGVREYLLARGVKPGQIEHKFSLGDTGMNRHSDCRRVLVLTRL